MRGARLSSAGNILVIFQTSILFLDVELQTCRDTDTIHLHGGTLGIRMLIST